MSRVSLLLGSLFDFTLRVFSTYGSLFGRFDDQDHSQHLTWSDRDSQTVYNGIVSILQKYTVFIVILYQNGLLA